MVATAACSEATIAVELPIQTGELAVIGVAGPGGDAALDPIVTRGELVTIEPRLGELIVVSIYPDETETPTGKKLSECVVRGPGPDMPPPRRRYLSPRIEEDAELVLGEVGASDPFPSVLALDERCVESSECAAVIASVRYVRGAARKYVVIAGDGGERAWLVGGGVREDTYTARIVGSELIEHDPDPALVRDPEDAAFDPLGGRLVVEAGGSSRNNVLVFNRELEEIGRPLLALEGPGRVVSAGVDGTIVVAAHSGVFEIVGTSSTSEWPQPEPTEDFALWDRERAALMGDSREIYAFERGTWRTIYPSDLLAGFRHLAISDSHIAIGASAGGVFLQVIGSENWEAISAPYGVREILVVGSTPVVMGNGVAVRTSEGWCEVIGPGRTPVDTYASGRSVWVLLQTGEVSPESDPIAATFELR